jgi:hypothetical protein
MDALQYVRVHVSSGHSVLWRIYCTHYRYVVASYHEDYSVPPMLYWMHELGMDNPHHVGIGVHLQCSVKTEWQLYQVILPYFRTTTAHNCITFKMLLSQKPLTPTCFRPYWSIIRDVNSSNRSTSCSNLLCKILSATHILHQEFPAALLHAGDQYIKQ